MEAFEDIPLVTVRSLVLFNSYTLALQLLSFLHYLFYAFSPEVFLVVDGLIVAVNGLVLFLWCRQRTQEIIIITLIAISIGCIVGILKGLQMVDLYFPQQI